MKLIGYARVSTTEQQTGMQLDALKRAGCDSIYEEHGSSVGQRPQLQKALNALRKGETLVVWKIDRLARSLSDLLRIVEKIREKEAALKSLTEHIDTGTPIGEFTLHILGAVAQLERGMIRERSMAGQRAAKERGKKIGRRRSTTDEQERQILSLYEQGQTMAGISNAVGVSISTVKRTIYRVHKPGHSSLK